MGKKYKEPKTAREKAERIDQIFNEDLKIGADDSFFHGGSESV